MQWYTGNTVYDTLLLVGFAYAILVMVLELFWYRSLRRAIWRGKACQRN